MKVLIVDDHDVVRRGLKQILADEFPTIQFGAARNADEAMALAEKKRWDAAIVDINMPGKSGLELMHELHQLRPKMPILILSVQPEDQYAIPVLKAGAAGYLCKDSASEELVNAFKKIISGGKYIGPAAAEKLAQSISPHADRPRHEALSYREFQVLRLLATGKGPSDIAAELKLSIQSISTYRTRILQKLKMKTTADLIRYAMEARLV